MSHNTYNPEENVMHTPATTPSTPQTPEAVQDIVSTANRRLFLKGTALVAGVAATGVLSAAAQDISITETSLKVIPRAVIRVGFDMRARPTFRDVYRSLEEVLRIAGCPNCGLVGLDLRFGLDQVLPLSSEVPATGTLEGGIIQGY
jgi:hypothetical protein